MRRTGMWLSVLAMVVVAGNASAIVTNGNWNDWFSYGGSGNSNWDQAAAAGSLLDSRIRVFDDEEGPTPGAGGQLYDIEQIFYFYQDADSNSLSGGTLHIGLVTGFPSGGDAPNYAGDLFLGLGGSGDLNIGVVVATDAGRSSLFGNAYFGSVANHVVPTPGPFVSSTPWRMDERDLPGGVDGGTGEGGLSDVTASLTPVVAWGGVGSHNFLEVAITLDGAGEELITQVPGGGLSLHWTMGCGNDVITVNDQEPFAPVPEPTTMVLLGMGILGIALRSRHPDC